MKLNRSSVVLTTLMLPLVLATQAAHAAPAPNIAADEPVFDFGERAQGDVVEHTFVIRNTGDALLEIDDVKTSCGCTVASLSSKQIEPGAASELTARLSLKGRRGGQAKAIRVNSNDPDTPQLSLTMRGTAVVAVSVHPNRLYFGQIDADAVVTRSLDIAAEDGHPLRVTGIDLTSPAFAVTAEAVEPGRRHRLTVTTAPPLPGGLAKASLRVTTDHPKQPAIEIPVSANVLQALTVAPREIYLNTGSGESVSRYVVVRPGTTTSFHIDNVEPPDASVQVQVTDLGANGYQIRLDNIVPSADLDGQSVKISTDVDGMSEILIPFRVRPGA